MTCPRSHRWEEVGQASDLGSLAAESVLLTSLQTAFLSIYIWYTHISGIIHHEYIV